MNALLEMVCVDVHAYVLHIGHNIHLFSFLLQVIARVPQNEVMNNVFKKTFEAFWWSVALLSNLFSLSGLIANI